MRYFVSFDHPSKTVLHPLRPKPRPNQREIQEKIAIPEREKAFKRPMLEDNLHTVQNIPNSVVANLSE